MTSRTPSSAFEHDPLPDSTTYFRLLHILLGDFGQHVECEISSWPIDDAPSYYAISYTWGDPADTAEITVNGKPLVVRRNCEYVLQQAFATKASRYYWVDAICIAQTSIQERNHQVGIMGKIYSGAKHVFACVGPHEEDSQYLMAMIDQRRNLLATIHELGQSSAEYDRIMVTVYSAHVPILKHVWPQVRCLRTADTEDRRRLSRAFIKFIKRPYFTRVWVLQELHLANGVSYCCGTNVQPGEYVRALDSLLEYWIHRHDGHSYTPLHWYQTWILRWCVPAERRSKEGWSIVMRAFQRTHTSRSCLRLCVSAQKQDLGEMLEMLLRSHCEDPRDRLYGILSLVKWPDGQRPNADYTKDNFEVAKHVLSLWSRNNIDEPFMNRCSLLFKLFKVTHYPRSLYDAIALRSSVAVQLDLRLQDNHASKIPRVQTNWRGMQVSYGKNISGHTNGQRQTKLSSCYIEQVPNRHFLRIRLSPKVTAYAHSDTKVGDWCLVAHQHIRLYDRCGLILRKSEDHGYAVVGPALVDNEEDQGGFDLDNQHKRFSIFRGYCDPEDLMVLAWTLNHMPGKAKLSDGDIEKFVNMRVCGWKGSSYFEDGLDDEV